MKIMCDHMVDPKHRSFPFAQNALELAAILKDQQALKILIPALNTIKQNYLEKGIE